MSARRCVLTILLFALGAGHIDGRAQSAAYAGPDFVASVRRNSSGEQARSFRIEPTGTVAATNVTVRHLMWHAYDVADDQIVDAPPWTNAERYDITLKSEGVSSPDKIRERLETLLHAVFALRVVQATRNASNYQLVLARADGRLGPSLKPASPPCDQDGSAGCGARVGPGTLQARGITADRLAGEVAGAVERPVENRTGLGGRYEIALEWAPSLEVEARPSIFTALEEQLGLRLVPSSAPRRVLIVQQVNRPAAQ